MLAYGHHFLAHRFLKTTRARFSELWSSLQTLCKAPWKHLQVVPHVSYALMQISSATWHAWDRTCFQWSVHRSSASCATIPTQRQAPKCGQAGSKPSREIIRDRERKRKTLFNTNWGPGPGYAPVLRGIPDGTFEFRLLFELAKKETKKRLQATQDELASRTGRHKQYVPTSKFSAPPK